MTKVSTHTSRKIRNMWPKKHVDQHTDERIALTTNATSLVFYLLLQRILATAGEETKINERAKSVSKSMTYWK